MRGSTWIVGVLLGMALLTHLAGLFLPPVIHAIAQHVGESRAGEAIIPPHLDEKAIRKRASQEELRK